MKLVGALISVPAVQKKIKGQMNQYIIGPYQKVVESASAITKENVVYDRSSEKSK